MIWFGHVERIDNELVQSREVSDGTLSTDFVQYLELKNSNPSIIRRCIIRSLNYPSLFSFRHYRHYSPNDRIMNKKISSSSLLVSLSSQSALFAK